MRDNLERFGGFIAAWRDEVEKVFIGDEEFIMYKGVESYQVIIDFVIENPPSHKR